MREAIVKVRGCYWRVRWVIWDFRETLLVRLLSQQMKKTNTLYVHPDPQCGPFAVVRLINHRTGYPAPEEPHGHVEGSKKYDLIPVFDWSEVPTFRSEREEFDWWDRHEITDRLWNTGDASGKRGVALAMARKDECVGSEAREAT